MPLPVPESGLVISYAYLWHAEYQDGYEEGVKNRPCVIILAVRDEGGTCVVTVAPITHTPPTDTSVAVEIPLATKERLGLDTDRSWVVTSEGNEFVWPGPDLRPLPGKPDVFAYGFVPPGLFRQIRDRMAAVRPVPRTE